jgi:hypothetical protein
VYLTWGDVGAAGSFSMFRRAKLMLEDVGAVAAESGNANGQVTASVHLPDDCGGPRCARLRAPALEVRSG